MRSVKVLYALAIFLSSSLLFLAEPMAGKRLLPLLGGSAAVWITCLVFFQTALFLGYLGAHALTTFLAWRTQVVAYLVLLALCVVQLVRGVNPNLRANPAHPIVSVMWLLMVLMGAPFLLLSATGPLLQAWYAHSARARVAGANGQTASQPYRLFAISNAGSLLGLVIYPWFIEPRFSLRQQSLVWMAGFVVFACVGASIGYSIRNTSSTDESTAAFNSSPDVPVAMTDRMLWVLLAAGGSLLLSAVTNYLSQNIAAIPLLWIIPLVVYLLTFVLAFSGSRWPPRWLIMALFALALAAVAYVLYDPDFDHLAALFHVKEINLSLRWTIALFCAALFLICLFCHSELHRRRPAHRHLTGFYLCIALGGALGAVFVGIVAPMFFTGNYELTCGLIVAAALAISVSWRAAWITWMMRILWLAAVIAMIKVLLVQVQRDKADSLLQVRGFYGTLRVTETIDPPDATATRTLYHGTIEHGLQIFSADMRREPTTYYARDSGVGLALELCCDQRPRRVGMIGLGTGTLAAYGRPGDLFRFYEINPQVEGIARNVFAYLRESAAKIEIVHGDARISMAAEPPQNYDVLVVDAFSGDAIPVHLLTAEALDLYRRHLAPGGIIAFHVSNHFLDLGPVVKQQAEHAGFATAFILSADDDDTAAYASDWVLVTANDKFLSRKQITGVATKIVVPHGLRLWTDDYNSLLPILRAKED